MAILALDEGNRMTHLEYYAALLQFKAEEPELYWKLFAVWLDWWSLEGRFSDGSDQAAYEMYSTVQANFYNSLIGDNKAWDMACIECWNKGVV